MDAHLSEEERSSGNRRNGKMSKKVQTKYGEVTIETPRDRDGTFQPETVKKRETILANGMADQIIEMYAMGTSTRDISSYFEREFNTTLSADTIRLYNRPCITRNHRLEVSHARFCICHLLA